MIGSKKYYEEALLQQLLKEFLKHPSVMKNPVSSPEALSYRRLHLGRSKLRASHSTSALLSGFALIAMIELNLDSSGDHGVPNGLLLAFGVCTTLVVVVHLMALMISTCLLPHIEAVTHLGVAGAKESPHDKFRYYIDLAWMFSTGLGILLFLAEIGLVAWVRFYNTSRVTAIVCTAILVPTVLVFVTFALFFYRRLTSHHLERIDREIENLDEEAQDLQAQRGMAWPTSVSVGGIGIDPHLGGLSMNAACSESV
ncbi:PREDICTED: protein orai-3-like [Priapulus caudatus]|uniref:Protein orai-3-like n=1 Tax=Priapulus caudatus TaxID=37621 RepID=A0ABM1EXS1_PRICU|nr:PREDICTED: protein orai-3-like [Priapulus caudatus]